MKTKFPNNLGLLIMRLSIGCMMLSHGLPKVEMLFTGKASMWADPIGIGSVFSLALAAGAEFAGSLFIIFGLFTRLSAAVLAVNMAVAAFVFHSGATFAERELAVFYFAMYLVLAFAGAGDFSVSHAISSKSEQLKKLQDL